MHTTEEVQQPIVKQVFRHELPGMAGKEVRILTVRFPPGVHSGPHRHPGSVLAYVLDCTVVLEMQGEPPQQYGPGDIWSEPPTRLALRESNQGWEIAKLLIFDLAERDQLLEFAEAAEEWTSAPHPETREHEEAGFTTAGHDTGGSR